MHPRPFRLLATLGLIAATAAPAGARRPPRPQQGAPAIPPAMRPPLPPPVLPSGTISWTQTAEAARGSNGLQLTVDCPAGGRLGSVWGTDTYTDDSSICSAAVHAGVITPAGGGQVTIEIGAGQASYAPSSRNGVTTSSWGAWSGSFEVVGGIAGAAPPPGGPLALSWDDTATNLASAGPIAVSCPAGGAARSLWGSGVYTDDSSICTAAVHAGVIGFAGGGSFDIQLRPGEPAYPAATSNGVSSSSWGSWSRSFVVIGGSTPPPPQIVVAGPRPIDWSYHAVSFRGRIGQRFDFHCLPGGTPAAVWGSGVYTDDSSICTAAVHAGLITAAGGGDITIEMVAGQSKYPATTRNGITTQSWPAWHGSYRFR